MDTWREGRIAGQVSSGSTSVRTCPAYGVYVKCAFDPLSGTPCFFLLFVFLWITGSPPPSPFASSLRLRISSRSLRPAFQPHRPLHAYDQPPIQTLCVLLLFILFAFLFIFFCFTGMLCKRRIHAFCHIIAISFSFPIPPFLHIVF